MPNAPAAAATSIMPNEPALSPADSLALGGSGALAGSPPGDDALDLGLDLALDPKPNSDQSAAAPPAESIFANDAPQDELAMTMLAKIGRAHV